VAEAVLVAIIKHLLAEIGMVVLAVLAEVLQDGPELRVCPVV
jgi:hypothetical protein